MFILWTNKKNKICNIVLHMNENIVIASICSQPRKYEMHDSEKNEGLLTEYTTNLDLNDRLSQAWERVPP